MERKKINMNVYREHAFETFFSALKINNEKQLETFFFNFFLLSNLINKIL